MPGISAMDFRQCIDILDFIGMQDGWGLNMTVRFCQIMFHNDEHKMAASRQYILKITR